MFYDKELEVLLAVFKKLRVNTMLINPSGVLGNATGDAEKRFVSKRDLKFFNNYANTLKSNIIYKLTDSFNLSYMFMLLPGEKADEYVTFVVGPYVHVEMSNKQIHELAKKLAGMRDQQEMENYLSAVPYISSAAYVYVLLETIADTIWGDGHYTTVDLNYEMFGGYSPIQMKKDPSDPEKTSLNMQVMEQRYAYENELMQAVAHGQIQKTEFLLSAFSSMHFEERNPDAIRNAKNYCIIMNTLLRKAAESGGVHPVYLDSVSSGFAHRIEEISSVTENQELMTEMFRSYCRLVRKHTMKNYSPPIQKVISTIDFDLTANLSLSSLAAMQNISPSYLSALFKQEVGQTLTEYVNNKRINRAMQLLGTTKMQVQTIAQSCGILDVHYFSKIFKKITGMTPKEYRESIIK